jgi:hypothetical protein
MIQYSEAPVLETRSYGVLDTPLARGMTTPGDCLQFIIGRRQSRISLRSIRDTVFRHCEERSDEAIHSAAMPWIASRSLSSGAHSRDPLARNDGLYHLAPPARWRPAI